MVVIVVEIVSTITTTSPHQVPKEELLCTTSGICIVIHVELYYVTNAVVEPDVERIICIRRRVIRMRLPSRTR